MQAKFRAEEAKEAALETERKAAMEAAKRAAAEAERRAEKNVIEKDVTETSKRATSGGSQQEVAGHPTDNADAKQSGIGFLFFSFFFRI